MKILVLFLTLISISLGTAVAFYVGFKNNGSSTESFDKQKFQEND